MSGECRSAGALARPVGARKSGIFERLATPPGGTSRRSGAGYDKDRPLTAVSSRQSAGSFLQLLGVCGLLFLRVPGAPPLAEQLLAEHPPASAVPSPRDVLGFEPGDDYTLADFRQLREYFRRLDAASDRVRLEVAGLSTEGNEMVVAIISSEANLARLDRYRDISRRLALVRGVSDAEARALAAGGQGRGLDRQRPARQRGRDRAARDPARPPGGDRRERRDADRARQRDSGARALHQSRRHEHGGGLVPPHAAHAIPGQSDAVAVPEVRGPRQQSRRLHADAEGDRGRQPTAVRPSGCRRSCTTSTRARIRRACSCRRFRIP